MSNEPLPTTLDFRKAVVRSAELSGHVDVQNLSRFQPMLADESGDVQALLQFSKDEEDRSLVRVKVTAEVTVICQRCLQPMQEKVVSDNTLAMVWNDEQAVALPKSLEPLIVDDTACDVYALVEDELILAMKPFSYHDDSHCRSETREFLDPRAVTDEVVEKPNPFDVLAQLKSDVKPDAGSGGKRG
ncbi:MAG: YceD family protein [Halioglobus sp.]